MDNILHDAWVLFVGIGSWMVNKLTSKLDDLDKNKANADQINEAVRQLGVNLHEIERKVDNLGLTSIGRTEFKSDITALHLRCNELEKTKSPLVREIGVKIRKGNGGGET